MENLDKLKSFIDHNREAFDDQKAPEGVWNTIEESLDNGSSVNIKQIALYSIAIISLVLLVWLVVDRVQVKEAELDPLYYAAIPDYLETQEYFISEVNIQWSLLKKVHADATLEEDMSLLDQNESELRVELEEAQGIYKERILNALIQNYQTKLSLLQKVLQQVEESENTKQIYHEM